MIQLGTFGNFFHAVWLAGIDGPVKLENSCFIGSDNVIAAGRELKSDLEAIAAFHPDVVVAGTHSCRVNCPECCDQPAYRNGVVRRYCEHLTEVGNYCILNLAGGIDDVCEKWFSGRVSESSVDHSCGASLVIPEIGSPRQAYSIKQKMEFIAIAAAVKAGVKRDSIALFASRGREVLLYKKAKAALLKTASGKAAALIENDRFREAETLMGSNPYFEALKVWEGLYCRRKKLEL
ncbi:MAG TPA: hypothetical protein HA362_06565 [Nanoarchaeota archaeon]|nr:hypothetical protein [Nanoarchaeota archaeon]